MNFIKMQNADPDQIIEFLHYSDQELSTSSYRALLYNAFNHIDILCRQVDELQRCLDKTNDR